MRNILSLTLLSALVSGAVSCSDSTTTRTNTGQALTATLERYEEFEDYSPVFSADGTKAVFLSNRSRVVVPPSTQALAAPLVYFYDAAAETKLVRFDDKLQLDPNDGKEALVSLNNSGDLLAFSRSNLAAGTNQLIVSQVSGARKAVLDLPAGASLSELAFARGSENYLAYVQRADSVKTLKVVKVSSDASAVTLSEVGSFTGQDRLSFQLVNGIPHLVSFAAADTDLKRAATVQSYDENAASWTPATGTFSVNLASLERPYDVNGAGIFSFTRLPAPKVRQKLGTGTTVGQDIETEKVTISDSITQLDVFASGLSYDFSNPAYLAAEPLGIAYASGSIDGQYLVLSGYDAYTCATSSPQILVQKLVRQSDMKMVTLSFTRAINTLPWTDVVTSACTVYDEGTSRELDTSISQADFVGKDGDFFLLALHSFRTFDEEIRLAKFKVDFDAGTVSELTITEISDNHR